MSKKWGKKKLNLKAAPADSTAEVSMQGGADPAEFILEALAAGENKLPTFTMAAYNGGPFRPSGWYAEDPIIVDLEGMTMPAQVPIDAGHMTDVGHTTKLDKAMKTLRASGLLSSYSEDDQDEEAMAARMMVRKAKNGFPFQASIDFTATRAKIEHFRAGESVRVNGRTFDGPVYVARASNLRKIAILSSGADSTTETKIAAKPGDNMDPKFVAWLKASGMDEATFQALPSAAQTMAKGGYEASLKASPPPVVTPPPVEDAVATMRAAAVAESGRISEIMAICAKAGNPEIEVNGTKVNLQAHAIGSGMTSDKVKLQAQEIQLAALQDDRAKAPLFFMASGTTHGGGALSQSETADVYQAALCLQAGIPEARAGKWFGEKVMNVAVGRDFRTTSIGHVMHMVIRAAGMHANPGKVTDDTIRTAIRADQHMLATSFADQQRMRASGFSTLSVSGILSNVANKAMLAAYQAQNTVWQFFAAVRSHNDFKIHTQYRLDSTGSFKKVGATGELKHVGLDDTSYTNQLDTYGAIIALNRQMMINDDLGAFTAIPMHLGRHSAVRIEEAFFVLLLSNPSSFFHSNNRNLVSGAGGVMTAANGLTAISSAENKFSDQVDSNAKPILHSPDRMLLGTGNYVFARNIYEGRVKITGKDQTEVANNEHAGKYTPYKSPYVNNTAIKDQDGAAITGQSSTIWWLFADPNVRAAMAIAFLNGTQTPTIESADTEFDTLGMQWRAFHDFGVGMEDPNGAVQIAGA